MPCVSFYIRSAFQKLDKAALKRKGCKLTKEEVSAISIHHAIPEAVGDYDQWKFDDNNDLIEEEE